MMPEVEHFSMTTTTTHTEVIAAMAVESQESSDDMDPMAFLEIVEMIEEYGTFTPANSTDGLQMFDVAIDPAAIMEDEIPTPEEAIAMCDADNNQGISWSEFIAANCDETDSEDMAELETLFNDADTDMSGELTVDEVQAFIDSVTEFYQENEDDSEMDDDMMGEMPAMQVAFTTTGDIEYFSMEMEGTEMMMYILTEDRVDALFTDLDAGETVALPFSISDSMYDDDWDDDWDDDGDFYCNDGTSIPMDFVNDGYEDCADGEDEMDMGGSDDEFMCDDGETIPMDWVNDGMDDCAGGEDEFDDSEDIGNLYDGCTESTDPADSYYECWMNDWLDSDGNIMMSDGYDMDECTELADGSGWDCLREDGSLIDDMIEEWLAFMDADGDGNITWDEHDTFIIGEDGWDSEDARNETMMIWSEYDSIIDL